MFGAYESVVVGEENNYPLQQSLVAVFWTTGTREVSS